MSHSGGRAVEFVFSVQNEQNIKSSNESGMRKILILVESIEHEEEVLNVIEFRMRLVVSTSDSVSVAVRCNGGDVTK